MKRICALVSIVLFVTILFSCEKEETSPICENSEEGFLFFEELDGCSWLIKLSDTTILEPINLENFDIELKNNKSVCVQYHERTDLGSYCMAGKVVELDFIE